MERADGDGRGFVEGEDVLVLGRGAWNEARAEAGERGDERPEQDGCKERFCFGEGKEVVVWGVTEGEEHVKRKDNGGTGSVPEESPQCWAGCGVGRYD